MWLKYFQPNIFCECLMDLDPQFLKEQGIRGLIIDLDNTMIPRDSWETPEELHMWITRAKSIDLKICIVSNNWRSRVSKIAAKLGLPLVSLAGKPHPSAFKKGMALLGTSSRETAAIGDQMFTDVVGANKAGLFTVLVRPLSSSDLFHTKMLRYIETFLLRRMQRTGLVCLEPEKISE